MQRLLKYMGEILVRRRFENIRFAHTRTIEPFSSGPGSLIWIRTNVRQYKTIITCMCLCKDGRTPCHYKIYSQTRMPGTKTQRARGILIRVYRFARRG